MSIIKLQPENFQTYRLIANPKKVFHSKSNGGITGSVALIADASSVLKNYPAPNLEPESGFEILNGFPAFFEALHAGAFQPGVLDDAIERSFIDREIVTQQYMNFVNALPQDKSHSKRQEVLRSKPGVRLDKNFGRKRTIKDALFPYYRYKYENLEWAYTNYNCLNFFLSDNTPAETALIYPAGTGSGGVNHYAPSSSFSFDFYVKPKVDLSKTPGSEYTPGTILHMSSCYAISLVSGSSRGPDGLADKFRILFQLSQSADIPPKSFVLDSTSASSPVGDPEFSFVTADNCLNRNEWHHISVRWGGTSINAGSGSIKVDGKDKSEFVIPSASVMHAISNRPGFDDPNAVFVGNYYEGGNTGGQTIGRYFNPSVAERDGLTRFGHEGNVDPHPVKLEHPLSAEIHDIKIFKTYKSDEEVEVLRKTGITSLPSDLIFFVPPYFTQEGRGRQIPQTPFFTTSGSSNDPFNVALSFGVGGLELNLENYCREFVQKEYPRFFNMTSSIISSTVFQEGLTSNDILYASGSSVNRLYGILPCDNGKFLPSFNLLQTGTFNKTRFVDDFGIERLDLVNLENMVSTSSLPEGLRSLESVPPRTFTKVGDIVIEGAIEGDETLVPYGTGSFIFPLMGASPEDPSVDPGSILTVLQRTGDPSSNEIVIFDSSNILYGDRIRPGSLILEDTSPFATSGSFALTLRDNANGSIYRSDTPLSGCANWPSVGNVIYEEGLIVLKSPHLSLFGSEEFKITFEGERSIYVFEVSIPLLENMHNSSSNPQYKKLRPTPHFNETAEDFTYITGVQLHDNNLNVVGRANLSQPYIKREEDRVVIKLRMDY